VLERRIKRDPSIIPLSGEKKKSEWKDGDKKKMSG